MNVCIFTSMGNKINDTIRCYLQKYTYLSFVSVAYNYISASNIKNYPYRIFLDI